MHKVILTPVALLDEHEWFICVAIRDPQSNAIIDRAFTPIDLAAKASLPLAMAQTLFIHATAAAQFYQ